MGKLDEWEEAEYDVPTLGTVHQLTEHRKKKIKRRPIGFVVDIDTLVEEDT